LLLFAIAFDMLFAPRGEGKLAVQFVIDGVGAIGK
jgi:hypothetical protein